MSLQENVFNSLGTLIVKDPVLLKQHLSYIGFKQFVDEVRLGERVTQFQRALNVRVLDTCEEPSTYRTVYRYGNIIAEVGTNSTDKTKPKGNIMVISNTVTKTNVSFVLGPDCKVEPGQINGLTHMLEIMVPKDTGYVFDTLVVHYQNLITVGMGNGRLKPKLSDIFPSQRTVELVGSITDNNQLLTIRATASYNLFSPKWSFEIYENRLDEIYGGSKLVGTWYTDSIHHLLDVQLYNRLVNVLCGTFCL